MRHRRNQALSESRARTPGTCRSSRGRSACSQPLCLQGQQCTTATCALDMHGPSTPAHPTLHLHNRAVAQGSEPPQHTDIPLAGCQGRDRTHGREQTIGQCGDGNLVHEGECGGGQGPVLAAVIAEVHIVVQVCAPSCKDQYQNATTTMMGDKTGSPVAQ